VSVSLVTWLWQSRLAFGVSLEVGANSPVVDACQRGHLLQRDGIDIEVPILI
jgi:hypothetical protein